MRVLIADDDPVYRGLLEDLMTKWHFEVTLAKDGQEALDVLAAADPPRMILLDWDMPRVDGFEVATTVRAGTLGDEAHILMITGSRQKEDLMRILVCGADDYLIKPFDPMDLKIHIRNAMRILSLREEVNELRQQAPGGVVSPA